MSCCRKTSWAVMVGPKTGKGVERSRPPYPPALPRHAWTPTFVSTSYPSRSPGEIVVLANRIEDLGPVLDAGPLDGVQNDRGRLVGVQRPADRLLLVLCLIVGVEFLRRIARQLVRRGAGGGEVDQIVHRRRGRLLHQARAVETVGAPELHSSVEHPERLHLLDDLDPAGAKN